MGVNAFVTTAAGEPRDEPLFLQLWTSEERRHVAKLFFPGRWCWCWSNSSSTT